MRRIAGQAARHCGKLMHRLVQAAVAVLVIAAVGLSAAAWRLSQGPWESAWLARRLEEAAGSPSMPFHIGMAALAWEGFRDGVDRPLDIRVTDVTATSARGAVVLGVPRGEVSLSVAELLIGRLRPRAIELRAPTVALTRAADGSLSLAHGVPPGDPGAGPAPDPSMPSMVSELGAPVRKDDDPGASRLGQLRRVLVRDATITVDDRQLAASWRAEHGDVDFRRQREGGVGGQASISVALGGQTIPVTASASLDAGGKATALHLQAGPVAPAALAGASPALARLAALDAPVTLNAEAELGPTLNLRDMRAELSAGAGKLALHGPPILLTSAVVAVHGLPALIELTKVEAVVRARDDGPSSTLQLRGTIRRAPDAVSADLALDLDQASFADLPVLWPELTPGGARPWLTENIVAGTAKRGHFDVSLRAPPDFSDVELTAATGTMEAEDLTVHWLRPVPPVDHGRAQVHIIDPDDLEIVVSAGHQQMPGAQAGGLAMRSGRMRIRGIVHKDQFGVIDLDATGSVPDTLTLLKIPRLKLLDKHPIDLHDPSGKTSVKLNVTLPLEAKLQAEQVGIHAVARLDDLHLGQVVAGRNLDQGAIDIDANENGLKAKGQALLAGVPSQLSVDMDFKAGPPSQVLQTITVTGLADVRQLAASGLAAPGLVSGTGAVRAVMTERRDGAGAVHLEADLKDAALTAAPLDWTKPAGVPATAKVDLRLDHDRLAGVDLLSIEGEGVSVRGMAEYAGGQPSLLRLDRMVLGRTQAQGSVRFPPASKPGAPYEIAIKGPLIDLSGRFSHHDAPAPKAAAKPASPPPAETRGAPWTADARFEQATMGRGQVVSGVALHAEYDGLVFRRMRLDGAAGPSPLHLSIEPKTAATRGFTASAGDAGALLRALDVVDNVQGGDLTVAGTFDDSKPTHPVSGVTTVRDFRIRGAPFMAKLLQGMTLYGLVEVAQGPGLGFIKLIAPFRLEGDALDLSDARAYSASLGMTAKGRLDIAQGTIDLDGTIVPAYLLNAALGNIPLIGKLFTSEQGGGLFAASYAVHGPAADPSVSVNPLSVLAPGFLRGLFGG